MELHSSTWSREGSYTMFHMLFVFPVLGRVPGGLAIGYLFRRRLGVQNVLIRFLARFFFSFKGRTTVAMVKITRKRICHENVKVIKSLIACRLDMGEWGVIPIVWAAVGESIQ